MTIVDQCRSYSSGVKMPKYSNVPSTHQLRQKFPKSGSGLTDEFEDGCQINTRLFFEVQMLWISCYLMDRNNTV